jgi:hypothetical protein
VAIKVLKRECVDSDMQTEFAQQVFTMKFVESNHSLCVIWNMYYI